MYSVDQISTAALGTLQKAMLERMAAPAKLYRPHPETATH